MTLAVLAPYARAADPFGKVRLLGPANPTIVKTRAFVWLSSQRVDEAKIAEAKKRWEQVDPNQILDRLGETLALGDKRIATLIEFCSEPRDSVELPNVDYLADKKLDRFVRDNLRVYYGRWLARNKYYDEAHAQFAELKPENVVDPATMLFFDGVCRHSMVQKEPALKAIGRLLDDVEDVPNRYLIVSALMLSDLQSVKGDSLDFASRLMRDAERRLRLARAGKRVRNVEDEVVSILDKLIKKLEDDANS
jgi:hypothetical protein